MFKKTLPFVIFLFVCALLMAGLVAALESIPHVATKCEKAGGVIIDGKCLRKDVLLK